MGEQDRRNLPVGDGVALARELESSRRNLFMVLAGIALGAATALGAGLYARGRGGK